MTGASAPEAVFEGVDFLHSDLSGADFEGASLAKASLNKVYLSKTNFSRRELGRSILHENLNELSDFLLRIRDDMTPEGVRAWLELHHLETARRIYANLKVNFLEIGHYDDASWAHIKERQITKKTHFPRIAPTYHTEKGQKFTDLSTRKKITFSIYHFIQWLLYWLAELVCGYGEKPMRVGLFSIVGILSFMVAFQLSGGIVSNSGSMSGLDYFNYSLASFASINLSEFESTNTLAQVLTNLEAFLGISMLALLMFVLGNRISRS